MASVELPPKPKSDDPTTAIKSILNIVEGLYDKFGLTSQKVAVLTTSSSDDSELYIPKLRRNLRLLKLEVDKLQDLRSEVADEVRKHLSPLKKLLEKLDNPTTKLTKGMKKDLENINKKIFNLMCQVPLLLNKRKKPGGEDSEAGYRYNFGDRIEFLPDIHANDELLKRLEVFRDVKEKFIELSTQRKICLLSFAVFPDNQEVNRTMLRYWWIGEGILTCKVKPTDTLPEDDVKEILKDFVDRKLIEPVENKRKVEPNSYKMSLFVHSSVVLISKEIRLFDMYHKTKKPSMNQSELRKVCLVEGSYSQKEAKATKMKNVDDIETVFNVSERFPDFTFKWFSEDQPSKNKTFGPPSKTYYKNLMVFYLGRWERTAKRHIEVENARLMIHLKHMVKLKLLSFQGISRIERLDDAVCKLRELIILDLRACYNLEKLPDKIYSLKALKYLDISDCYMIDRMPKRLSWLDNLEVLKGFVVSDATDEEKVCTLADLKRLKKLRKLSITINKGGDFTVLRLFVNIKYFNNLEKLKVAWGAIHKNKKEESIEWGITKIVRTVTGLKKKEVDAQAKLQRPPELPKKLKKLDLQCFPDPELPSWLEPAKLLNLEKFYIKGGTELTGLGELPKVPTKCSVKVLRLKFLPRMKVEWRDLKELYFPQLVFLDKYQCPQVSFCPCDGTGVWREKS